MPITAPAKLFISSDGNIIHYVKTIKTKTELLFVYKFVVSESKMDLEVSFTEKELGKNMLNFFKVIE